MINQGFSSSRKTDTQRAKELDDARKAGKAPPEKDEEGNDINPFIPQYIKTVPWYMGADKPTLRHQRNQNEESGSIAGIYDTYLRGKPSGPLVVKFRKGACENCGAMTHKKKDCMERPRKLGAKFTNKDIKPDEFIQPSLKFDYDGKRDHWANYDTSNHMKLVEEYNVVEEMKRKMKTDKLESDLKEGISNDTSKDLIKNDDDILNDEDKIGDETNMPGQKFDSKQRLTVRNLRIREDTAKYLYNLDLDSAFYDPKSRSMRENPLENSQKLKAIEFQGENVRKNTGEMKHVLDAQLFTWKATDLGVDVHLQADPTKAELLLKEYQNRATDHIESKQSKLIERYGGEEYLHMPPKELLYAQTENYTEYSKDGKLIVGEERGLIKSKYEEDVLHNNHTEIWGSYWSNFQWGYACCKSTVKNSYCVGMRDSTTISLPKLSNIEPAEIKSIPNERKRKKPKKNDITDEKNHDHSLTSENKKPIKIDHSSNYEEKFPTESEMEQYYMTKKRSGDPMENYNDSNNNL